MVAKSDKFTLKAMIKNYGALDMTLNKKSVNCSIKLKFCGNELVFSGHSLVFCSHKLALYWLFVGTN